MPIKRNTSIIMCSGLIFGCMVLSSCHTETKPAEPETKKVSISLELNKQIALDTAKLANVSSDITLFAKVSADQDQLSNIYPLAAGLVIKVNAMLGDYVREGQELATLRSGEVNDFQNQYNLSLNTLHLAQKNALIAEELYKTKVISERDLGAARGELRKAQFDSARVKQLFTIYGAKIDNQVPEYKIVSPIDGYIIAKNITSNMAVRTDNGNSLFTISPLKNVWVLADVYETDVAKISPGQVVDVTTVAYPDTVFKGTIQQVSSIIDPVSKTLKVRVVLENKNGKLKPEMFAHVKVKYEEPKRMVQVPVSAVVFERNKNWVMIYHSQDQIETREVTVYKESNNKAFLTSGLKEGERVISKAADLVYSAFNSKN